MKADKKKEWKYLRVELNEKRLCCILTLLFTLDRHKYSIQFQMLYISISILILIPNVHMCVST